MSGEYCGDCSNRGDDPESPHIATYCFAWHQKISNKSNGNEEFISYYNGGHNNGCPHYASGPPQLRKQSSTANQKTQKPSKKIGRKILYTAVVLGIVWLLLR